MVTSQKKAPDSSASDNELSPDQTLGLVSLSLMQKLSQKDPSFSWLGEMKPDQLNLKNLRDRLELTELAIKTGAPLTTSEVSILMGAKPGKSKIDIQRFKGLGEMNPSQLRETVMDPKTRRLVQLTITPSDNVNSMMDLLLSKKNAGARKEWLEKRGKIVTV